MLEEAASDEFIHAAPLVSRRRSVTGADESNPPVAIHPYDLTWMGLFGQPRRGLTTPSWV